MYKLHYAEFYITNVCNLNCNNCNRFNNFAFSGHQIFEDYKTDYVKWSKLIDFDTLGIIGGEPLLNPDFFNWMHNISALWPNSEIRIITNGTQFNYWQDLYEQVLEYKGRVNFYVSHHTPSTYLLAIEKIKKFLKDPVSIQIQKKQQWIDYNPAEHIIPERIKFIDTNNIQVDLSMAWKFMESTIKHDKETNQLSLHNSDPVKAYRVCLKCHHFIKGKLYKCGPMGILPDFIKQFKVNLTDNQKNLLDSYEPAEHDWDEIKMSAFIKNLLGEHIPQCSLCPQSPQRTQIIAGIKKPKIQRA
jgi:organic radical activating enzyme